MAKTKRGYILAACLLSGAGAVLNLVSLGTQNWVQSKAELLVLGSNELTYINYGLFTGVLEQNYGSRTYYELEMTCLFSENVCALLCGETSDERKEQLEKLNSGQNVSFNSNCPRVNRVLNVQLNLPTASSLARDSSYTYKFLNAGVWLSALIFLILAAIFGLLSAGLSVWNAADNPVEALFNVLGLYVYNGAACFCSLLVLLLWGGMFAATITDNVGVLYTITGVMNSHGMAALGFSYWLVLVSFVLYAGSLVALYVRQYMIEREPQTTDVKIDEAGDPAILLY